MVVVSANGVDFRSLVVKNANEVGVQTLFNLKKNFRFAVFGYEYEM